MTVKELNEKLSYTEYLGWIAYFSEISEAQDGDKKPVNMLEDPEAMLGAFKL